MVLNVHVVHCMYSDAECTCCMLYSGAEEKPILNVPWTPTTYTALKALLSARLCAAIWSNISDCDETYNYWEPVSNFLSFI